MFTLVELVNELGIGVFDGGRVEPASFRLRDLFRVADADGSALALRHAAYQELLAAEFLRSPQGRDAALAAALHPRLTEEVREFLHLPQPGHQPARHDRIGGRLRGARRRVPGRPGSPPDAAPGRTAGPAGPVPR